MNDIKKHCEDNLGGIFNFKIIPINEVQSLSKPVKSIILEPLVTALTGRWYDFYCTEQTMKYNEVQQISEHGNFYKAKLVGLVPKDRADVIDILNEMNNKKFIIDYTDNNNLRKLIGTVNEPLEFLSDFDTGSSVPNKNGYSFEFFGNLLHKAPIYNV